MAVSYFYHGVELEFQPVKLTWGGGGEGLGGTKTVFQGSATSFKLFILLIFKFLTETPELQGLNLHCFFFCVGFLSLVKQEH
jgi:hypothetical protein